MKRGRRITANSFSNNIQLYLPQNRLILLEKLTVLQLILKFPAVDGM
jgi:hypothetical protein